MDLLADYNRLNNSFQKKYIFNFGSEGGFYSEFNNMIFGMIYCLKYNYKFILYTGGSQFKINKGWEDFFKPFCEEITSSWFHNKFNRRIDAPKIKLKYYPIWFGYKLFNKNTLLTYELFHSFHNKEFEKERFDFPELGLKGNLKEVSQEIVKMLYCFNDDAQAGLEKLIQPVNLPAKYIALHIRRGDKATEVNLAPISDYVRRANKLSDLKEIFISSDDYTVIEELQQEYPELNLHTLVKKEDRGHVQNNFARENKAKRKQDLIALFASIEIMASSTLTIGAFTTNLGLFLGMYMPEEKFISIQKASWYQFERDKV
jgi:hypothetical protein